MSEHVIVAGGGPAGLLTALGLARGGTPVTVLEAGAAPNTSPRAMVYHWPVLDYLERLGILDDCVRTGFLKQDYAWRLPKTGEMIEWSLDCLDGYVKHPHNLHLGQDKLSLVAIEHLKTLPHATILFDRRVTAARQDAGGVTVTAAVGPDGAPETLEGTWLIGADGASSAVREDILGLNFFGTTWPERFVATNIRYDFERYGYKRSTIQTDDELGAIIVKISDDHYWRVTYMEDAALPVETVRDRIDGVFQRMLPGAPGEKDYELVEFSPYRMHQRVADTMRVGRILLVGDAGHITNPTGGLGLTSGMFDSFALVDALNRVIHEGADDEILDRYSHDRRRKFIEIASPRATQNKLTTYHLSPGKAADEWVQAMRDIAKSPQRMREVFSFTTQLASHL